MSAQRSVSGRPQADRSTAAVFQLVPCSPWPVLHTSLHVLQRQQNRCAAKAEYAVRQARRERDSATKAIPLATAQYDATMANYEATEEVRMLLETLKNKLLR